jgi:Ca2+-binding EF-hand superfamily protein
MRSIFKFSAAVLLAGFSAVVALANKAPNMMVQKFHEMDTNKDSKISPAEHDVHATSMFSKMDVNTDSMVSADEMNSYYAQMKGHDAAMHGMNVHEKVMNMDTDKDGTISPQEHAERAKQKFSQMDINKDGFLNMGELQAGHQMKKVGKMKQ